jgi:hypothetical protein
MTSNVFLRIKIRNRKYDIFEPGYMGCEGNSAASEKEKVTIFVQ